MKIRNAFIGGGAELFSSYINPFYEIKYYISAKKINYGQGTISVRRRPFTSVVGFWLTALLFCRFVCGDGGGRFFPECEKWTLGLSYKGLYAFSGH